MGGCCSVNIRYGSCMEEEIVQEEWYRNGEKEADVLRVGDYGATVRLQGSSKNISMYTQQGRKGLNQDAMTVWERFAGNKDIVFCGVFDGHGPAGHKIARHVRDHLPSKLSSAIKQSRVNGSLRGDVDVAAVIKRNYEDNSNSTKYGQSPFLRSWKASLIKAFDAVDEELSTESAMDSYCSGTTAVNIIKQGEHLVIANLGDSRAVLCTRDDKNQLVPVQLTTDLKPDVATEAERIRNCQGRVFAIDEEPDVFRIWMPDDDCPGLAMARAFGDFCLKDYGLISVPEITYRKLTRNDEFVVLATDGVWDVLTNHEVIRTIACAGKREIAAKMLVHRAVRAWKTKYPGSKIDDCAVVCLFLGHKPLLTKSKSDMSYCSSISHLDLSVSNCGSHGGRSIPDSINGRIRKEEYSALQGVIRVNSLVKLPRGLSRRISGKPDEDVAAA